MSDSIFRIWSIARFEAKVIMRGWTFRIALLINLAALIAAYVICQVSIFGVPFFLPGFLEIPSSYPHIGMLYSNIIISIAGSLIAAGSIDRALMLDSNEAVFSRSFSILEYAAGKGAALFLVFLIHIGLVLAVTFVNNLVFTGAGVAYSAYLIYPFLICLPTYVFFTGTAMLLQAVTGSRALTLTALIGSMAFFVVFAAGRFYYAFDAAAFGMPMLLSVYTGLSELLLTVAQRGAFLLAGAAMASAAYLSLRRPRQSRPASSILIVSVPVLVVVSIVMTAGYIKHHTDGAAMRSGMMATAENLRSELLAVPESFEIELVHTGGGLEITTTVALRNDTDIPLERYFFNLNPGLEVRSVSSGGRETGFRRTMQIIEIEPAVTLQPGGRDTVTVACSGTIDDRACFPDADESERWRGFSVIDDFMRDLKFSFRYKYSRFRYRKQFSFVTDDYLLLPPHAMWYPAPGLVRGSQDPGLEHRFFAGHRISIRTRAGLTAVAQGTGSTKAPGIFEFIPEDPLPGVTVAAGRYRTRSTDVDSVTYSLSTLCPDDYFFPFFEGYTDTIPSLIKELQDRADSKIGLEYPFSHFAIVETPANFFCFPRPLVTNGREYSQPGLILAPERGYNWHVSFIHYLKNPRWKRMFHSDDPDLRVARSFKNSLRGSILDAGVYIPINSYYSGVFHLGSAGSSALDHALESHFAGRLDYWIDIDKKYEPGTGRLARTIIALDGNNLPELLSDRSRRDAALSALPLKGKQLIIEMQGLAGEREVDLFLADLLSRNRGRMVSEEEFLSAFEEGTGHDLRPVIERWQNCTDLPGFIIDDVEWYTIVDNGTKKYQFRLKACNREQCHGMIRVLFSFVRKRGRPAPPDAEADKYVRTFLFGPGEGREIGIVTLSEPRTVYVNTVISKNLPPVTEYRTREFENRENVQPFDGSRIMDCSGSDVAEDVCLVDNTDPGFEVVTDPGKPFLQRIFGMGMGADPECPYVKFRPKEAPVVWRETVQELCYGPYVRSAHWVVAGEGTGRVRWTVDIPESGTYDVYHHMVDNWHSLKPKFRKKTLVQEYHFSISHDEGVDDRVLVMHECPLGWNLLGTYYFTKGRATVELTDESPKWFILADAVKWVKKD